MKKFILAIMLVLIASVSSFATPYYFSGTSAGGIGSATMDLSISVNTLTMLLDNTSPTTLIGGTGFNSPGITGFGFNLDPNNTMVSWELSAFSTQSAVTPILIGSNVTPDDYLWKLATTQAGITMDYLTRTKDIKGALYNPDATDGFGAAPNFFTQAILTMTFATAPILDLTPDEIGGNRSGSEFVRMQNVGAGGAGSLKLTPGDGPPPVPEPSTLLLFGAGLTGLAVWCKRRRV